MAKKKTGLSDTVTLRKKKELPKKDGGLRLDVVQAEQDIKEIHRNAKDQKTVRLSIDVPSNRYKELKIKVATEDKTIRQYFLELLENDLMKK